MRYRLSPTRIREARLRSGLLLREVGAAVDRSAASVSQWEWQSTLPTASVLRDLADVLGVRIEDLYEEIDGGVTR